MFIVADLVSLTIFKHTFHRHHSANEELQLHMEYPLDETTLT